MKHNLSCMKYYMVRYIKYNLLVPIRQTKKKLKGTNTSCINENDGNIWQGTPPPPRQYSDLNAQRSNVGKWKKKDKAT